MTTRRHRASRVPTVSGIPRVSGRSAAPAISLALAIATLLASAPSLAQPAAAPVVAPVDQIPAAGGEDAAWNRGVPLERRQQARALLLEGNRLFQIPLFARAADKYKTALTTWGHPAFRFNLALAQLNAGEDLAARDSLERVLRDGDPLLGQDRLDEARKQLREVERRLGRIRIRCATPGAEVTLDGKLLFTAPGRHEGWVEPRGHEITAKEPDHVTEVRRVTVGAGELGDVELEMITLDAAADSGRRWAKWKPWTVIAGGAAIAIGSGALHTLAATNFQTYDQDFAALDCSDTGCTREQIGPALNTRLERATLQQQLAVAGYITGGVLVVTGAVLMYFNQPGSLDQRMTNSSPERVAVQPTISGETIGIVMTISH